MVIALTSRPNRKALPEELIPLVQKELKRESSEMTTVCRYGYINNGEYVYGRNPYCHAAVPGIFATMTGTPHNGSYSVKYPDGAKDFFLLNALRFDFNRVSCTREAFEFLVNWAANDSPFADDVVFADEYGVVLNCGPAGMNISETMWLCKVLRLITEGADAPDTFMTLVKGGVNDMLAVLVSSYVRGLNGGTFSFTGIDGHSSVFRGDAADLNSLIERKINKGALDTATVFKTGRAERVSDKIHKFCTPFIKSDGWGGQVTGKGATATQLIESVLGWQKELGYGPEVSEVVEPKLPDRETVYLEVDM